MSRFKDLQANTPVGIALESVAPPTLTETGWDVLLALFGDEMGGLKLDRLAAVCSVAPLKLTAYLAELENRRLVTGRGDPSTNDVRAILTAHGRSVLRRYFAAASDLTD